MGSSPNIQLRCNECGRYSKPAPLDGEPEPGMVDKLEPDSWVTTGLLCPDCASLLDKAA